MGARPLLRPHAIPRGATVGVCAPSGPVNPECVAAGIAWLEAEGLRVRAGRHLHERRGYLAGDDASRASDLLELVGDPEVDAIVLARGGYGLPRLLDTLDPKPFRRARKPIVGYSDATALLLWLRSRAGLASVHGPMLERSDLSPAARARLLELLRGAPARTAPLEGTPLARGRAAGPLVGGNLKMLCASLGTSWEIDTRGAIVFFEEVNEQPYAIDRMLVQLRSAGKLGVAAGIAVGALVGCESERYPEVGACDVLRELLPPSVNGPVVIGLPFGHVADNRALGSGVAAVLDGRRGTLSLEGPVVEGKG